MCCRPQLIAKMISTVIVLTFVAFASASPLAERQSPPCSTTPPALPEKCNTAWTTFIRESGTNRLSDVFSFKTIKQFQRVFVPFLDTMCASDCLSPIMEEFRCHDPTNVFARLFCSRSGGRYCLIKFLEALRISGVGPMAHIWSGSGTCSSSSAESLRTLQDHAGCCAASYSVLESVNRAFATCNVTLGTACPVSGGWSTTVPFN